MSPKQVLLVLSVKLAILLLDAYLMAYEQKIYSAK